MQYLEQLQYHPPDSISRFVHYAEPLLFVRVCVRAVGSRIRLQPSGGEHALRGDPTVTLARDRAAIGSPLKVSYKFAVAQNASIPQDYLVFVHVLERSGGAPVGRPSLAGAADVGSGNRDRTLEYTRTVSSRTIPTSGRRTSGIGLYSPSASQRLPLCATDIARRDTEVAKFQLLPQSENIFLVYKDGWAPGREVSSVDPTNEWQVDEKAATVSFKNPKKGRDVLHRIRRPDWTSLRTAAGHRPLGRPR